MAIEFIKNVVIPVFCLVAGGLLLKLIENQNIFGTHANYSRLSGQWYGVHISKNQKTGALALSRHDYELKINKKGEISGTMNDRLSDLTTKWTVKGYAFPGGIALIDQNKERPGLYAAELYSDPLGAPTILRGVISSFNYYDEKHFAAIIILSKSQLSEDDFKKHLADLNSSPFYTTFPNQPQS
jgi:hypothetical protein